MEATASRPVVDREKTAPFLIRTFIKIGGFHRLALFEDGTLPTTDEQQIFTWRDATLREVLTTLRITAPQSTEFRHPLARYSFKALYADSTNRGQFAARELGIVYSRDILGEPGSLESPAPRLLEDTDGEKRPLTEREREERTLEELRFVPGDYLCVAVMLPKNVPVGGEIAIKGSAGGPPSNGWRSGAGDGPRGFGAPAPSSVGLGRGGGHWRGGSDVPPLGARGGRGGRADPPRRDLDRGRDYDERDRDRRVPPPRMGRGRDSPPHRGGYGGGYRRDRHSLSRSRSRDRSPPKRRDSRY